MVLKVLKNLIDQLHINPSCGSKRLYYTISAAQHEPQIGYFKGEMSRKYLVRDIALTHFLPHPDELVRIIPALEAVVEPGNLVPLADIAVHIKRRHRRIVASPQFVNCGLVDDSLVLPIVFIALFKSFPRQSDYTDAPLGAGWEEVST